MDRKKRKKVGSAKSGKSKDYPLLNFNHLRRFSVVIITTVSIVIAFAGSGFWIDKVLDTKPWFLILFVVISFPVTQYAIYIRMKEFTRKEFKKHNIKTR